MTAHLHRVEIEEKHSATPDGRDQVTGIDAQVRLTLAPNWRPPETYGNDVYVHEVSYEAIHSPVRGFRLVSVATTVDVGARLTADEITMYLALRERILERVKKALQIDEGL